MTKEIQQREREGRSDDIFHVRSPWPGFRLDVERAVYGAGDEDGVFVSRAERRRARGKAHDATIKQVKERDGETIVYERSSIEKLGEKDLVRIKDADRDHRLVTVLRDWIAANKPKDKPPLWRYSDGNGGFREEPIRKVRLATTDRPALLLRGGTADRTDMVRVDVFRKRNRRGAWEYYTVPIYPFQIADTQDYPEPPKRAAQKDKVESERPLVDESFEFLFSLHPLCYVEMVTAKGDIIEGYFRELNSNDAGIVVSDHTNKDRKSPKTGSRTLREFRKFTIDRLGRKFEIKREERTWRGRLCRRPRVPKVLQ